MSVDYRYREEYFKHNKGIFGVYFCSYCGRPMINKRNMEVDHIIPKSKNKKLLNAGWNTTISCKKCNRHKSDKVSARYIAQGYSSKTFGAIGGVTTGAVVGGTSATIKGTGIVTKWGISKLFECIGWTVKSAFTMILWTTRSIFSSVWWMVKRITCGLISMIMRNFIVIAVVILFLYVLIN
jgi:hypothetical protein